MILPLVTFVWETKMEVKDLDEYIRLINPSQISVDENIP